MSDELEFYIRLGNAIRIARKERGLSQEELAQKIGLKGRTSINNIELGRQRVYTHTLCEIAEVLYVHFNDLLPIEDGKKSIFNPEDAVSNYSPKEQEWIKRVLKMKGND